MNRLARSLTVQKPISKCSVIMTKKKLADLDPIVEKCRGEGLKSDFLDNKSNVLSRRQQSDLMAIFAALQRKLNKGADTSQGDIDDVSNDSGSKELDLDFLTEHGHLQTVLNMYKPKYASQALNRIRFRDGD